MNAIQTILHPTDFSEPARHAFHLACSLTRDHEARLVVLYVAPNAYPIVGEMFVVPPLAADDPVVATSEQLRDKIEADHLNLEGLPLEYRVEQGDPVDVILRVAEEEEAGLIVLGTHGRTGLERVFMGSVAEKIVRKAPGSVLAVKAPRAKPGDNRVNVAPRELAAT